jgi:hypothetical protein
LNQPVTAASSQYKKTGPWEKDGKRITHILREIKYYINKRINYIVFS